MVWWKIQLCGMDGGREEKCFNLFLPAPVRSVEGKEGKSTPYTCILLGLKRLPIWHRNLCQILLGKSTLACWHSRFRRSQHSAHIGVGVDPQLFYSGLGGYVYNIWSGLRTCIHICRSGSGIFLKFRFESAVLCSKSSSGEKKTAQHLFLKIF